ncbi:hypothetical protein [Richelia intracellularis]|uniref:hypothetical protein n=1 Tax=Richelia intracellularis TaxID=1164990 RepID=UPI000345FAD5|nr:hypothetical protein [Richelia intracellularis]HAE05430.1 hypothetical protein [Richelia sp.]
MNRKFSLALLQIKGYLRGSQNLEEDFKSKVDSLKQEYPNEFNVEHMYHIAAALGINQPEKLWEEEKEGNINFQHQDYLQGLAEAMVGVDWMNGDEIGQTLDAAYDDLSASLKSYWTDNKTFREAVKSKIRDMGLVKELANRISKP